MRAVIDRTYLGIIKVERGGCESNGTAEKRMRFL